MSKKAKPSAMKEAAINDELIEAGHDPEFVKRLKWGNKIKMLDTLRAEQELDAEPEAQPLFIGMPDTKDYIFDGHAGAGPSGAKRWMNCTASLGASRAFLETLTPEQAIEFAMAGAAARQGTTAHAAAEAEARLMLGEITQQELDATLLELTINPETEDEAYSEEMAGFITEYTDLIETYATSGRQVLIEYRVTAAVPLMTVDEDGDPHVHEIRGSVDCGILPSDTEPVLTVIDLKYGEGEDVDPTENPQGMTYALGLLAELVDDEGYLPELDHVEIIIAQPRLGGIKTWKTSVEDLLAWRDDVLSPALTDALAGIKGGAKFSPSPEVCQWCPARGGCAALAEQRLSQGADLFDAIVEAEFEEGPGSFPETGALTDARLGTLLTQALSIEKITADLKAEAQRRLLRGEEIPGFQLVSYTPPRKWNSEARDLIPRAWPLWREPTLMTPKQALSVLSKDADFTPERIAEVESMIETPDKRPVIGTDTDRRKPWTGRDAENMFDILNDDE